MISLVSRRRDTGLISTCPGRSLESGGRRCRGGGERRAIARSDATVSGSASDIGVVLESGGAISPLHGIAAAQRLPYILGGGNSALHKSAAPDGGNEAEHEYWAGMSAPKPVPVPD